MTLKSSPFFKFKKGLKKKRKPTKDLLTGGITALIGLALLAETAAAVRRV